MYFYFRLLICLFVRIKSWGRILTLAQWYSDDNWRLAHNIFYVVLKIKKYFLLCGVRYPLKISLNIIYFLFLFCFEMTVLERT